jgi:hypothetical protein
MATIAELISHKYATVRGMNEMKGVLAVCSMIQSLGKAGKRLYRQRKRDRDRLVMMNIRYLPKVDILEKPRDALIKAGLLRPAGNK